MKATGTATRRGFVTGALASSVAAAFAGRPAALRAEDSDDEQMVASPVQNGARPLVAFPQKQPLLMLSQRPPLLETPFHVFDDSEFTPNDAFFVRWHLADIPLDLDEKTFRVRVHGLVQKPLELSVNDLRRQFETVELAAVAQCAGNSRAFSHPRVPGGQWFNGAMGNARWQGVRLKDVLARAGLTAGVKQIRFNGADKPVLAATPDFVKALDADVATSDNVLLAFAMNGAPLPRLNGYPLRLVVPGYFSTYWVKMLDDIEAIDHVDDGYWMKTAYRVPDTAGHIVEPTDKGFPTVPISTMVVRSFITSIASGETFAPGTQSVRGIAFDSGSGIRSVQFSSNGKHWREATLLEDRGKFAFRRWEAPFVPQAGTSYTLSCRAVANSGEIQSEIPEWNPGGYLRNTLERYTVKA